jgi:sec-independent protein translocase protein TatA
MLGGHIWELAIVLALALVVFGPKRLPEIGGALGKGIREFKQGTSETIELPDPGVDETPPAVRV